MVASRAFKIPLFMCNFVFTNSISVGVIFHTIQRICVVCCLCCFFFSKCMIRKPLQHAQVPVTGWLEAFAAHPRIGDMEALRSKHGASATMSREEQAAAASGADDQVLRVCSLQSSAQMLAYRDAVQLWVRNQTKHAVWLDWVTWNGCRTLFMKMRRILRSIRLSASYAQQASPQHKCCRSYAAGVHNLPVPWRPYLACLLCRNDLATTSCLTCHDVSLLVISTVKVIMALSCLALRGHVRRAVRVLQEAG